MSYDCQVVSLSETMVSKVKKCSAIKLPRVRNSGVYKIPTNTWTRCSLGFFDKVYSSIAKRTS